MILRWAVAQTQVWSQKATMAARPRKEPDSESTQKNSQSDQYFRNIVEEYREILQREFSDERRQDIKDDFAQLAADPAIEIVEEISATDHISKVDRINALKKIYDATVASLNALDRPEMSSTFWSERGTENRFMDPCDFVELNYPSYNNGLTLPMIASHDKPLYWALKRKRRTTGWKKNFNLPLRSDVNDAALANIEHPLTLKQIAAESPPHIRELLRLYEVSRSRKRSTPKTRVKRVL